MIRPYEKSDFNDNELVGFVGYKVSYISWLFVHPHFRGQGIGKKLAAYVLSKLNGETTLTVAKPNTIAINLYKSLGFILTQETTAKYQGNPIIIWKTSNKINER